MFEDRWLGKTWPSGRTLEDFREPETTFQEWTDRWEYLLSLSNDSALWCWFSRWAAAALITKNLRSSQPNEGLRFLHPCKEQPGPASGTEILKIAYFTLYITRSAHPAVTTLLPRTLIPQNRCRIWLVHKEPATPRSTHLSMVHSDFSQLFAP